MAGRAIRSDLTRTETNAFRARYANNAVKMNAIFANGNPAIPGTHSEGLPTNATSKIASHMLYAEGNTRVFEVRTLMPLGSVAAALTGTGSIAIVGTSVHFRSATATLER